MHCAAGVLCSCSAAEVFYIILVGAVKILLQGFKAPVGYIDRQVCFLVCGFEGEAVWAGRKISKML